MFIYYLYYFIQPLMPLYISNNKILPLRGLCYQFGLGCRLGTNATSFKVRYNSIHNRFAFIDLYLTLIGSNNLILRYNFYLTIE